MNSFALVGILVSAGLALRGYKKQSLSQSGSLGAFLVGFLTFMAGPFHAVTLIAFYGWGTFVTKIGAEQKGDIDGEYKKGGQRDIWQVLSNAGVPTVLAVVYAVISDSNETRRQLLLSFMGIYACCIGDTSASELGILSPWDPILITTLKRAQPGTNGGVSLVGTAASLIGGLLLAIMQISIADSSIGKLSSEISPVEILLINFCGSLIGTTIDSFLGALLQLTIAEKRTGRILNSYPPNVPRNMFTHLNGRDILSNNQVNLISSTLTGLIICLIF